MADNVTADPGSGGAVFATDEISSVHYPITKITFGALDSQTLASSGSGAVDAGTQRVILATDQPVIPVSDNGGSLTVDGTVTANLSATDNAVLDTIDAVLDTINAKLVSGTVIGDVNLGATDNAVLDAIASNTSATKTAVELIDNAISGSEMQVDVVASLPAGTNAIGKLAANSGVDIGDVDVTSIAAGSNLIGDVGIGVRTSGGTTPYKNLDVDETEDEVKGTAGQVYWIHAINTTAVPLYLKFYNATAASVTVGSTTPVLTLPVPANADSDGAGFTLSIPNGIAFGTAITIAATTGVADADTGAPGANALIVNLGYN